MAYYLAGDVDCCLSLLVASNRLPEAAVMARAYQPSSLSDLLSQWKAGLKESHPISSHVIDDQYPSQELEALLTRESQLKGQAVFGKDF